MSKDLRLGKDVISRDGTFTGMVSTVYRDVDNVEWFIINGYDKTTDSRATRKFQPGDVIAVFQGDEKLFSE